MIGPRFRRRALSFLSVLSIVSCESGPSLTAPGGFSAATTAFEGAGDGITPRFGHVAARLPDGRVLVAGGRSGSGPVNALSSSEYFNPATGLWSPGPAMIRGRFGHTVVTLSDGRLLVAGGVPFSQACADPPTATSAEIFDPVIGAWTATGSMSVGRAAALAVRLADGRVLVAGGGRCGFVRNQAEIYDPGTSTWTATGNMNVARASPAGALLADGRVLVAGGTGANPFPSLASAEIYDPASGTWTLTGAMTSPRAWSADDDASDGLLVRLADGRVFAAGGLDRPSVAGTQTFLATTDIYDPTTGAWTPGASLAIGRYRHRLALLPDGRILIVGGRAGLSMVAAADLFNPATGTIIGAGSLITARADFTATTLTDGRVLIAAGQGSSVLRSAELFTAGQAPVASAGPAVSGAEGSPVQFDGTGSMDLDGDPLTFTWDLGDGNSATGPTPAHTYAENGTYTVTLRVSDGVFSDNASTTATIANVAPVVTPIPGAALAPGETYSANGSFTDPGADRWTATVDYGDGSGPQALGLTGGAFSLSRVYGAVGTFTVTVTVSDDDGGVGTAQATIVVAVPNQQPLADAGPAAAGAEGSDVSFDGRASSDPDGTPLTFSWTFGDGASGTGPMPGHAYADNGTYIVTLTVSDGELVNSAVTTATISNVAPAVGAIPGADLAPGGSYTAAGSFTDPGADVWTATVNYGDGSGVQPLALVGKTFALSHTYGAVGTFTVTVTVHDDDAGTGAAQATVTVVQPNRPPVANAGPAASGAEGSAVSFDGRGSSDLDGDALTYAWTFGDGASGTGATPAHVYADNGTYVVTLTVSDGTLEGSATTTATITNVAPAVSALPGAQLVPGGSYVAAGSFTDPGADVWTATVNYGDGSGVQPLALVGKTFALSHIYGAAGIFTVTVVVNDGDGGVGSAQASVTVVQPNRPPVANAGPAVTGPEGSARSFDGRGSSDPDGNALTYAWTFGDGTTGTGPTPSKTYADNGTYVVTLTVSDGALSAVATTSATIANVAPAVNPVAGATIQQGATYTATGTFTDPGADAWTATVNYGDGSGTQPLALAGKTFALSRAYSAAGTFTVTVTVRDDDGGVGSAQATVQVQAAGQTVQQQLTAILNALNTLAAQNNPPVQDKLEDAAEGVAKALEELAKTPPDREAAVGGLEGVLGDLEAAVSSGLLPAATGVPLMDQLAGVARRIATDAIALAQAQGRNVTQAQQALAQGDAARAAGRYKDAAARYKDAISKAK